MVIHQAVPQPQLGALFIAHDADAARGEDGRVEIRFDGVLGVVLVVVGVGEEVGDAAAVVLVEAAPVVGFLAGVEGELRDGEVGELSVVEDGGWGDGPGEEGAGDNNGGE